MTNITGSPGPPSGKAATAGPPGAGPGPSNHSKTLAVNKTFHKKVKLLLYGTLVVTLVVK